MDDSALCAGRGKQRTSYVPLQQGQGRLVRIDFEDAPIFRGYVVNSNDALGTAAGEGKICISLILGECSYAFGVWRVWNRGKGLQTL